MAQKIINARAKNKRDTSANWTAADPVLLDGEIIIVDTADGEVREKIGDGIKTYTQLPFSDEKLRNLLNNHEGDSDIHVTAEEKAAWSESDVFIATYGTTTSAEIEAANQAGKAIFLKPNDNYPRVPLSKRLSRGNAFRFILATSNVASIEYRCIGGAWSTTNHDTHASTHAAGGSDAIAPSDIGAIPVSGGTMTGALVAAGGTSTTAQVRNVYFGTTELTAGEASSYPEGTMYFCIEE